MTLILAAVLPAKSTGGSATRTGIVWVCRHCGSPNLSTSRVCRNRC
ncbi:MAG: hypothetical protein JWO67_3983 [Streptosporangiaceae bacterium]|nr:hypothetical protein [Streptosporangiaceae bacterium]